MNLDVQLILFQTDKGHLLDELDLISEVLLLMLVQLLVVFPRSNVQLVFGLGPGKAA